MKRTCFVIMSFDERFSGIWNFVITKTVNGLGDICIRGDSIFRAGSILEDIYLHIEQADYILADLTVVNANVYYELGYAHALKKQVILISQNESTLPFDLKHQRVIYYTDTANGINLLESTLALYIKNLSHGN